MEVFCFLFLPNGSRWNSSAMLNSSAGSRHSCFVLDLRGKLCVLSHRGWCELWVSVNALYWLGEVTFYSYLVEYFIMKGCWILPSAFLHWLRCDHGFCLTAFKWTFSVQFLLYFGSSLHPPVQMESGATIVTFRGFHDDSWTISQCFSLQACDSAFSGLVVFSLICILPSRFLAVVFSWFCFDLWLCAFRNNLILGGVSEESGSYHLCSLYHFQLEITGWPIFREHWRLMECLLIAIGSWFWIYDDRMISRFWK